MNRRKIRPTST